MGQWAKREKGPKEIKTNMSKESEFSQKHRKAKVQQERPKSKDRCREGQKFREKSEDRNS